MDTIKPNVIIDNSIKSSLFSIKDLYFIRGINKEWSDAIKNFKYVEHIFKNNFESFTSIIKNENIDLLKNSDINIIELEKILINMQSLQYREYGEKYGEKFKQKLIDINSINNIRIKNTLIILKSIYKYSLSLMKKQLHAPTDISKYPVLWTSDYLFNLFKFEFPEITYVPRLSDIFNRQYIDDSVLQMSDSITNLYELYKVIIFSINKINYSYDEINTIEEEIILNIKILIYLYEYIQSYFNRECKVYFMIQVMNYIYNELFFLKNNNKILQIIKSKAQEMYNETSDLRSSRSQEKNYKVLSEITHKIIMNICNFQK